MSARQILSASIIYLDFGAYESLVTLLADDDLGDYAHTNAAEYYRILAEAFELEAGS